MTDTPSGKELVEKAFVYMQTLSRECRKALTGSFTQTHRGLPFGTVEPTLRKEIESWFTSRDKNITVKHESSARGRPGEVSMTYSGANKDAHFKFHIDTLFTLAGNGEEAPAYLKNLNVFLDKREFSK